MADIKCPQCDRSWPDGCEQTACIELLGSCIVCNKDDINQHLPEIQRRAVERRDELSVSEKRGDTGIRSRVTSLPRQ